MLYREYIRQYMMLLLEQDIPVLLFMETRDPEAGTAEPLSYRMLQYPVELFHHVHPDIAVVPLQASHMFAPAAPDSGVQLDFRHMLLNSSTVVLAQPVPLAVYAYRRNAPRDIGRRVRQQWCESAWLYEHYLVCAVLEEAELQVPQRELKKRLREFLPAMFPSRAYVPGDVFAKGLAFLKRAEVVLVRDGMVSVIDRQQAAYYAARVQCMISEKSVSRNR
jgi:hypothetical protein